MVLGHNGCVTGEMGVYLGGTPGMQGYPKQKFAFWACSATV